MTKVLFVTRFASPSELRQMNFRELSYYYDTVVEHAKAIRASGGA